MIKIPEIKKEDREAYEKDTFKRFKGFLETVLCNPKYNSIISYFSYNGQLDDSKIKQILTGNISVLKEAIKEIGILDNDEVVGEFNKLYNNFTSRVFGKGWAEKIGVKICPYCNRSYVFTLKGENVRPQYDHFFPKSKYPYLALSMYNLVPCCSICNSAKSDENTYDALNNEETYIYPFRDEYGNQINFRLAGQNKLVLWTGNANEYNITIVENSGVDEKLLTRCKKTIKDLRLEKLYNKHNDYIRDIIYKAYVYNDEYFSGLVKNFPMLFSNEHDAKNFTYMNYLDEENWDKRILSKLTHDIIEDYKIE